MNITATRFATKARTWLLIAGLTALLIVIGSLLGGAFLYLFVGLAIAMNVAGYWFSDKLALQGEPGAAGRAGDDAGDRGDGAGPRRPRPGSGAAALPDPVPAAERVRDRAQPAARGRRGHRGAAAAPAAGPGQGRARARVRAHQEPRHPRDVDRRDGLGRDRRDREHHAVLADLRRGTTTTRRSGSSARSRDHRRAARGDAAPARRLAPARVPRRRDRRGAARAGEAARRRARDARARRAGAADEPEPGRGLALRGQPAAARRHLVAVHDAPADAERIRRLRALDGESAIRLVA